MFYRAQLFEGRLALGFLFLLLKTFLWVIFSVIFKSSDHQPVDKMKLSHLNSNFALTLHAWDILTQR